MTGSMQRQRAAWLKKRFPNRHAFLAQAKREVALWQFGARAWHRIANAELAAVDHSSLD